MKELQDLIHVLDEWEAADDRANEAATVLGRPARLSADQLQELRNLHLVAAQKLEAVRRAVATEP